MKTVWMGLIAWTATTALIGGCKDDATSSARPGSAPANKPPPRVELSIGRGTEDWGKIVLLLDENRTPVTTHNFLRYVEEGYYDGTIFHRIKSDFMIQGGGFTATDVPKTEGQHPPIRNESLSNGMNAPYTIAMARTGDPHSATSEFFINVVDNTAKLGRRPPEWGYTVFGIVVSGREVVERIRDVEVKPNPMGGEVSVPLDPPVIRKATVLK